MSVRFGQSPHGRLLGHGVRQDRVRVLHRHSHEYSSCWDIRLHATARCHVFSAWRFPGVSLPGGMTCVIAS